MKSKSPAEGIGPIKTLLDKEAFNQVHLIGDYDRSLLQHFSKWLKVSATIHPVDIKNPTDHSKIYQIVDPILESMNLQRGDELCFHLSPGTPAMNACDGIHLGPFGQKQIPCNTLPNTL